MPAAVALSTATIPLEAPIEIPDTFGLIEKTKVLVPRFAVKGEE